MNDINTEQLVKRAMDGDKSAADEIYRQYSEPLTKFVIKQGLSEFDAQDVVSDTFVEMMKHIDQLKDPSAFSSWIHTIAKRKAWEAKEKSARRQDITAAAEEDGSADPDQALELAYAEARGDTVMLPEDYAVNEDLKQIIAEQLESLSAEYKEALFLFYYKDKSINEIAEMTGTNTNNVKQRLYAARKKLKTNLEKLQKSGVVLCAVPLTKFIPLYAEMLGNIVPAAPSSASAQPEQSSPASHQPDSSAPEGTSAATKAGTAARSGAGLKIAGAVIAAAVIGSGIYAAGRPNKSEAREKKALQKVVVQEATPAVTAGEPLPVPAEPMIAEETWRQTLISHLTSGYGTADGLTGFLYDTDGDDIPEVFVRGRLPQDLSDDGDSQHVRIFTCNQSSQSTYLISSSGISADTPEQMKIWCSGDPSPDNLLCLIENENYRRISKTKNADNMCTADQMDEEEAKAIFDFDTQPHILLADNDRGFEEIGDFSAWINSWDGNFDAVTEDPPVLSYGTMSEWQKSYFDHANYYEGLTENVRCAIIDVNGDDIPELLLESCDEVTGTGVRINNKSQLSTCNSSGERTDTLTAGDYAEGERSEVSGGFTFSGTNDNMCVIFPQKSDEFGIVYLELYHTIENGKFEYHGDGDRYCCDSQGMIIYFVNGEPAGGADAEARFKKTHYNRLNSENVVTTCPVSFDRQADITWFDTLHKTEMFLDYASRTNNN